MKVIFLAVFSLAFAASALLAPQARAQGNTANSSGADSEEGWIIKKTKDGIIKVPKKQNFKFGESAVEGAADRPSETILGTATPRKEVSLIPVKRSYKREFLEDADYQ